MVESSTQYEPTQEARALIFRHLGDEAIIDSGYKKQVLLTKDQAIRRAQLVSDIEYDFQLALQKGAYYLGKAVINFYLNEAAKPGELFLNL